MDPQVIILRKILDDAEARNRVKTTIRPEHFLSPAYRFLFSTITTNSLNGAIPLTALQNIIDRLKLKPKALELVYSAFGDIQSMSPVLSADLECAVTAIAFDARRSFLVKHLNKAADYLNTNQLDSAQALLKDIAENSSKLSIADERMSSLRTFSNLKPDTEVTRYATGFKRIDDLTFGGRRGELWLWAAYTAEFKSTALMVIAHQNLLLKRNVLYLSFEMDKTEVQRRFIARHACYKGFPISFRKIVSGALDSREEKIYRAAVTDLDHSALYGEITFVEPPYNATIDDVLRYLDTASAKKEVDILILDYIQKLKPLRKWNDKRLETVDVLERAKRLAMDANQRKGVLLISGYQISRDGRKKAEEKGQYNLWDLSESGGAEQNANVVCWSLYTDKMKKNNEVKVGLAKARDAGIDGSQHYLALNMEVGLFDAAHPRDDVDIEEEVLEEDDLDTLLET